MVKKVLKWTGNALTIICVLIILVSLTQIIMNDQNQGSMPSLMGYKFMTILSDSMSPALRAGDLIVSKEKQPQDIKVGDVITYRVSKDTLVTHRVAEIINQSGIPMFKTKGDANNVDDKEYISPYNLVGVLQSRIPYGGYVGNFVRSREGVLIFIVIPAVALIIGEVRTLMSYTDKSKRSFLDSDDKADIKS